MDRITVDFIHFIQNYSNVLAFTIHTYAISLEKSRCAATIFNFMHKKAKERTASKPSWLNQNVQCVQHEKEKETCLSINGIPCPHICSLLRFYLRFRCSFGCIQMLQHTNTQISNERTNLLYVRSWQHIILKMRRVTNQSGNLNGFCRQNLISAQLLWFDVHDALSSV